MPFAMNPAIIGNAAEPEKPSPADSIIGNIQEARIFPRIIPRAKPVYPPPPPFEMPKFSNVFAPWVWKLMTDKGTEALVEGAKETKKKADDELKVFMRTITYPEPLINEAVNRHLLKFGVE